MIGRKDTPGRNAWGTFAWSNQKLTNKGGDHYGSRSREHVLHKGKNWHGLGRGLNSFK